MAIWQFKLLPRCGECSHVRKADLSQPCKGCERKKEKFGSVIYPPCPYCKGIDIKLFGKYKNKQRYWCVSCKRKFTASTAVHTNEAKRLAKDLRKEKLDIKTIARKIGEKLGGTIHFTTIYKWGLKKPPCPHCGATNPYRYGKYKNEQKYLCRRCNRKFGESTALHVDAVKKLAVDLKRDGRNIKAIAQIVGDLFHGTLHFSTIYEWALQAGIAMRRGRNRSKKQVISSQLNWYEHEHALAGNTGIAVIDEMSRNTEVRQQSALECLLIGLENLCEEDIRNIVKRVKKNIRNEELQREYKTISLYAPISKGDEGGRCLIDVLKDIKSADPLDLCVEREEVIV